MEAQKMIDRAAALSTKSASRNVCFVVTIITARVRAASGKPSEAVKILASSLAEAVKAGLLSYQLEARLEALEKEAKNKGFGLIAQKAAAARR